MQTIEKEWKAYQNRKPKEVAHCREQYQKIQANLDKRFEFKSVKPYLKDAEPPQAIEPKPRSQPEELALQSRKPAPSPAPDAGEKRATDLFNSGRHAELTMRQRPAAVQLYQRVVKDYPGTDAAAKAAARLKALGE